MPNRAKDWIAQAERDMEQATASQEQGRHEWACFAAQQSAEKAVKALHLALDQKPLGYSVSRLLRELPVPVDSALVEKGEVLDRVYIPSRYPDSHPGGAPFEHYGPPQSGETILHARAILEFVRSKMP